MKIVSLPHWSNLPPYTKIKPHIKDRHRKTVDLGCISAMEGDIRDLSKLSSCKDGNSN